jgi:hypothetical protein
VAEARPWTVVADGIVVVVRLTPKGGRDSIEGIERLADRRFVLKARVRAVASEGEANDALMRLFANALDVAPRQMSLIAGATARIKRLQIAGDGVGFAATLERLTQARKA